MFKVGQEVVCIDNTPRDNRPETKEAMSKIKEGKVYVIREIFDAAATAIALEGVISPYSNKFKREIGYKADRFRPVDTHLWVEELLDELVDEVENELTVKVSK